jgi:hypothetical protein
MPKSDKRPNRPEKVARGRLLEAKSCLRRRRLAQASLTTSPRPDERPLLQNHYRRRFCRRPEVHTVREERPASVQEQRPDPSHVPDWGRGAAGSGCVTGCVSSAATWCSVAPGYGGVREPAAPQSASRSAAERPRFWPGVGSVRAGALETRQRPPQRFRPDTWVTGNVRNIGDSAAGAGVAGGQDIGAEASGSGVTDGPDMGDSRPAGETADARDMGDSAASSSRDALDDDLPHG